jgi:hypothetical protein
MTTEVSSRIALRIIVDGSTGVAEAVWAQVRDAIAELVTVNNLTIREYWKFQNSQEISGTLGAVRRPDDAFEEVARRLASGWSEHTNDAFSRWTVWNRGDGDFIAPAVRWAHLELIRA